MTTEKETKHTSIAAALAAAQMDMGKALKSSTNPHFKSKYADLGTVVDACLPALNKHGIAVIQPLVHTEHGRDVVTRFIHESGETLDCPIPLILGKNDMQGLGSAMTYARRYGLMALAGIAPEDDDGNAAAKSAPAEEKHASWAQTIIQDMDPSATPRQKAEAIADALVAQFGRMKGKRQLSNEWDRRAEIIAKMEGNHEDLHTKVIDAYENRMMEITGNDTGE